VIALFWLGCMCGTPAPDAAPPVLRHYAGWRSLVRSAARGDVAACRVIARDLTMGEVAGDHHGAETVGAALGFLQVAEAAEDLPLGVERAAAGCRACHAENGVVAPAAPEETAHPDVAAVLAHEALWGVTPTVGATGTPGSP